MRFYDIALWEYRDKQHFTKIMIEKIQERVYAYIYEKMSSIDS